MSKESRKLVALTNKIADDLGIKFCTGCNYTKAAYGGLVKHLSNGRTRWVCAMCAAKNKPSGFKGAKHAVSTVRLQDDVQSD